MGDLKRGIDKATERVCTYLADYAKAVESQDEIRQVATISANNEESIGTLIAEAMKKVGKDGVITIEDGQSYDDQLEVVEGMKFDRGFISPYFITDQKAQTVELEKPLILLVESKISSLQSLVPLLESVIKTQRPLLIIAEDVEGEALSTLVVNKLRGGIKVCAVKSPGFGDNRKATLQDIAVLTGGQVISDDLGLTLESVQEEHLGQCEKIKV